MAVKLSLGCLQFVFVNSFLKRLLVSLHKTISLSSPRSTWFDLYVGVSGSCALFESYFNVFIDY